MPWPWPMPRCGLAKLMPLWQRAPVKSHSWCIQACCTRQWQTPSDSQLPCTLRAMYLGTMSHRSAAMSHGLSCHVPPASLPCYPDKRFPCRPIPASKGCFISQTDSCLTCFLWVMTCLAHSFLVFTPSRRPSWAEVMPADRPPTLSRRPTCATILADNI